MPRGVVRAFDQGLEPSCFMQAFAEDIRGEDGESPEALLERHCRHGDEAAFDQLVHRFEREIYNYLLRYLRNPQLAEEVFQATFFKVHEKCHQFDSSRRFRPWLYTIATHEAVNALREEGRHRSASLDQAPRQDGSGLRGLIEMLASETPGPLAELERNEWQQWTRQAVDSLPEYLRVVVLLIYFQGLKYREAAEVLDIPVGTVKSRSHKALMELNSAWKRDHPRTRSA